MSGIKEFLKSIDIPVEEEKLAEHGYDDYDVDLLRSLTAAELDDLCTLIGLKRGHQVSFQKALQNVDSPAVHFCADSGSAESSATPTSINASVRDMLAPNPLDRQVQFYNEVFLDCYKYAFPALSNVQQFRQYVRAQQVTRWKHKSAFHELQGFADEVKSGETTNGRLKNVHNYAFSDASLSAADVSKLEEAIRYANAKIHSCNDMIVEIKSCTKNSLSSDFTIRKHWKLGEVQFYTEIFTDFSRLLGIFQSVESTLKQKLQGLRRRFTSSTIEAEKEKTAKQREKANLLKSAKRKLKRHVGKAVEILRVICVEEEVLKVLESDMLGECALKKLKVKKIVEGRLTQRFHLEPLAMLIDLGLFEDEALEDAIKIRKKLENEKSETKELNVKRKENSGKKVEDGSKQRKLTNYFHYS